MPNRKFDEYVNNASILFADMKLDGFIQRHFNALSDMGSTIVYAENAEEAIYEINKSNPNLIILGQFSDMSSLDFARRLKFNLDFDSVPIIFLSDIKESTYIVDCFKAGAVDFVDIACEVEELVIRVQNQMQLLYLQNKNDEQMKSVINMQTDIARQSQEVMLLNDQLADQTESLKELNSQQNRLFSLISHDLRGPLYGMNSLIETLHTYYDKLDDEDRKRKITLLGNEGSNLFKLMESILLWSEIQLGEFELFNQDEKLSVILNNAAFPMIKRAEKKEISLNIVIGDDMLVNCDLTMIHTVIQKLLSNSIKFTERGGKIKVIANRKDNYAEIKIVDSGIGIPSNNLTHIFTMSSKISTRGTENEKGTGLGLPICKSILNLHNQDLKCHSIVGEGSVFYFKLPIGEK
jgi:signal transduction histidine kinase